VGSATRERRERIEDKLERPVTDVRLVNLACLLGLPLPLRQRDLKQMAAAAVEIVEIVEAVERSQVPTMS
jgi:hypothetical protein